jgi:hypothetical protein
MPVRLLMAMTMLAAGSPTSHAVDVPRIGRPTEDFYGAVGERVRVTTTATPTEIAVEDAITFTLTVHGCRNPGEIERPDLRRRPDFAADFVIDDLSDDGADTQAKPGTRSFRYRLRPKHDRVREIPLVLFRYYDPRLDYFPTTAPEHVIALTIQPRPATGDGGLPMPGPDFLFVLTPEADEGIRLPDWLKLMLALVVPAIGCGVWYMAWQRRYPDAAILARQRRERAVRRALDALTSLRTTSPDPAAGIGAIVLTFVRDRTGLPLPVTTPNNVVASMRQAGVTETRIAGVESLLREIDAARFGLAGPGIESLRAGAERVIRDWEAGA